MRDFMSDLLHRKMVDGWEKWHGNDIDIPTMPCSFERGFRVAVENLGPVIEELVELMERSDMEEFGVDCQPVTNGEWFPAIEKAKRIIAA